MIEVNLIRIVMDEKRGEQLVVLREKKGTRTLPIIIGIPEASAIKVEVSGLKPPRPLTHDLLKQTIEQLGAHLEKVIIDKLEGNTFFAKLVIKKDEAQIIEVDSRPSDGIALALRAEAPIYVNEGLLEKVGSKE
jgi:bifunctional DNase/RNase